MLSDTDKDGIPDHLDNDVDGDGIPDHKDHQPLKPKYVNINFIGSGPCLQYEEKQDIGINSIICIDKV